jgi:hypothetical protein
LEEFAPVLIGKESEWLLHGDGLLLERLPRARIVTDFGVYAICEEPARGNDADYS